MTPAIPHGRGQLQVRGKCPPGPKVWKGRTPLRSAPPASGWAARDPGASRRSTGETLKQRSRHRLSLRFPETTLSGRPRARRTRGDALASALFLLAADGDCSGGGPRILRPAAWERRGALQTLRRDACVSDPLLCHGLRDAHHEPCCCAGRVASGRLPVPRAQAVLPYWVPLSLQPRQQIQKMLQFLVSQTLNSRPCLCHCFRVHFPVSRSQVLLPYWVPRILRFAKKVVKRQWSFRGLQERPLDLRPCYNCWRVCCSGRLLLEWQQLQALCQDELETPGKTGSPPDSLLPVSFTFLACLQTVLRAIRQLFWV
ncbi:uncharacterized protein C16orf95 homolog [Ochotona princeps]|uniref:uncharacterized protein C16orf95 homolog n=1 Tax=Ochotona princeps TaxID=9978 RepID=UPI002714D4F9|nr:uncharacterized protein C16orf95 homolog [Ochotona princeps]